MEVRNTFKGLGLIDRVPDELWTEVRDIVQEAGIKTIPKEKNAKWLSEETLKIVVNRREVKGKGEKESYTHLNAEFQRIARRDKKVSAAISAKKKRKTIEWERLGIFSRKLEIPNFSSKKLDTSREYFMQRWAQ